MKKILIIIQFILLHSLHAEIYQDRILVYIDNSIENFYLSEDLSRTNLKELNEMMDMVEAIEINIWLPNARPTDRDGDIYLNRYYVIELGSDRSDIEKLIANLEYLPCIRTSETMIIMKPDYTPNDPRWNQQYGLELIQADLAYDLRDIEVVTFLVMLKMVK